MTTSSDQTRATTNLPGNFPPPATVKVTRAATPTDQMFANPFTINDLAVFDDATLRHLVGGEIVALDLGLLADALHGAAPGLRQRMVRALPRRLRAWFGVRLRLPAGATFTTAAQRSVLDALFWELTYWQTPDLYEALTAGEQLHPRIFQDLRPVLQDKIVLDSGAGSGRATFAALRAGARHVYAADPSPGLLRILERKAVASDAAGSITSLQARFAAIPLPDNSVDTVISSAAFTADPQQGGEPGLTELLRVTRPGGMIVLIWPRPDDYPWLAAHGFHYVAVPITDEMRVDYRSLPNARRIAQRFYAHNAALWRWLRQTHQPAIPFRVLGVNPPRDYCWLRVAK